MLVNYSKIIINYKLYNKFLSFSKINKKLLIKGFFGEGSLVIPKNIIIEIDNENVKIFSNSSDKSFLKKVVKPFCINFLFLCYGLIFSHFLDLHIKGIGYKFKLNEKELVVYNGNSLPTNFKIPDNLRIIANSTSNLFSVIGSDYTLLNNFAREVKKIATPNKYKEIGVYVNKRI